MNNIQYALLPVILIYVWGPSTSCEAYELVLSRLSANRDQFPVFLAV